MSDNVTIPASGTGTATPVVATDDVGGAHYQRVKVDLGGDGAASPLVRGQQAMAASVPVVIASDQSDVPVSGPLTDTELRATPVPVSGTVTATVANATISGNVTVVQGTGTNLHAVIDSGTITTVSSVTAIANALPAGNNNIGDVDVASVSGNVTVVQGTATNLKAQAEAYQGGSAVAAANPLQVTLANTGANTNKLLVTPDSVALPANQSVNVNQLAGTATSVNSGTKDAGTLRVVLATDQPALTNALTTTPSTVASATLANVASSASNVTLQASNASRKGWYCFNDSTQVLYVKFGATASSSSFTVKLDAGAFYEMPVPVAYTGIIDGIWASANGNARVTEL